MARSRVMRMRRFLCGGLKEEHEQGDDYERGDRADSRALGGELLVGFVFRGSDHGLSDHGHRSLDQEDITRHARYAEDAAEKEAEAGANDKPEDKRNKHFQVNTQVFKPDITYDLSGHEESQRAYDLIHIFAEAHYDIRQPYIQQDYGYTGYDADDRRGSEKFFKNGKRRMILAVLFVSRKFDKSYTKPLCEAGAHEIVHYDIWLALHAEQFSAHRISDKERIRKRGHHHEDSHAFLRQLQGFSRYI